MPERGRDRPYLQFFAMLAGSRPSSANGSCSTRVVRSCVSHDRMAGNGHMRNDKSIGAITAPTPTFGVTTKPNKARRPCDGRFQNFQTVQSVRQDGERIEDTRDLAADEESRSRKANSISNIR